MARRFHRRGGQKAQIELITDPAKGCQAVMMRWCPAGESPPGHPPAPKRSREVSGAKPWRQKGTGRARAGHKASPIWVGGGVAFGPHPRDYSKKIPKKVKALAFRKAFSERILGGDVLLVEDFAVQEAKTKRCIGLVVEIAGGARKVLVIGARVLSRNLPRRPQREEDPSGARGGRKYRAAPRLRQNRHHQGGPRHSF